jgi:lipopolysaccharide export system protein LptC
MAGAADSHSRIVFWLKIILPLAALAVLSTLFLFSRNIGGDGVIPFSDVDLDALAREQRLTAPEYSAMTRDGAALTIRSIAAQPQGDGAAATGITATYAQDGGLTVDLTAALGSFDSAAGTLVFSDGVRVKTSSGYVLLTDSIVGRLDQTSLASRTKVTATAPFGRIDAGAMQLDRADVPGGDTILVFNKGVRLIYDPKD